VLPQLGIVLPPYEAIRESAEANESEPKFKSAAEHAAKGAPKRQHQYLASIAIAAVELLPTASIEAWLHYASTDQPPLKKKRSPPNKAAPAIIA
jgi:hypothetical protein